MEDFDAAAADYDATFTNSCVGEAQREQVWKYVDRKLANFNNVLEVNCGTGEDAHRWQFRQKDIVATDISPEMIGIAKGKFPEVHFRELDITQIDQYQYNFDTLFSNFGGLNCLSPNALQEFFSNAHAKLDKNGHLVLVLMGKKCLWERFYFTCKGKLKEVGRRNTDECVAVNLDGDTVETWYFSPKDVMTMTAQNFDLVSIKPIGLFIPPSYLAPAFEKRKRMFRFLKWLDGIFTHSGFSNSSDHFLVILKKRSNV
jgi:SAM-dependent methyltransferase